MSFQFLIFMFLIVIMKYVNKTFQSIYPFYNSLLGVIVGKALVSLINDMWKKEINAPLKKFLVVGEADFLMSALPKGSVFCPAARIKDGILPFEEADFTNVIVFNAFTERKNEKEKTFVRELARILSDDGKILFLAVKESSFWTYDESIPYKYAVKYRTKELRNLIASGVFTPVSTGKALLLPPALYKESFVPYEQRFKHILGLLGGITAIEAWKITVAYPDFAASVTTKFAKKIAALTNS